MQYLAGSFVTEIKKKRLFILAGEVLSFHLNKLDVMCLDLFMSFHDLKRKQQVEYLFHEH